MASVDTLPFAQPAARPEQAAASKPAPAPAPANKDSAEPSFADVLDTEVDAVCDTRTPIDAAPADPAAIPAQPVPPPAAPPVNTTAAVFAALLLAPVVAQAESEAPAIEPSVPTAAPPAPAADTLADPAIAAAAPVDQPAPKVDTSTPTPAALAPAAPAPAAPVTEATPQAAIAQAAAPAVAAVAAAAAKAAQPAKPAEPGQDTADAAAPEAKPAAAPDAAAPVAAEADTAPAATPAQTQSAVTLNAAISNQPALITAAAVKPLPPEPSMNAPGSRRGDAPVEAASTANADTGATKAAGAQSVASGAAPTAAASAGAGKPNAQAAAATAVSDAAPDIKPDAAAPSTAASTSFADTLAAARGQTPDAARAHGNPHLQSAPAAAVQVYTRLVERFDGRAQRFEVRLDPAELGRIDVRIEIGADKKVHAVLAAHDSAAMSDLMRGQRALERALSDAGIDLAEGGLRFELSSDSGRNLAGGQQRGDSWSNDELAHAWRGFSSVDVEVEASPADVAAATRSYFRGAPRLDLVA